ncbi:MAG: aminotransferase class V-fold PLP-dependent enzyme [Oscillospiraceae bacterium]|nr:aminotransferase class V-fold PLP-dependent enzyme [Oscillospiraceae bacterium]
MIYLDSAATSFMKPASVARAMAQAVERLASPGRGSYRAAMEAADLALCCREEAARLLGAADCEQVVFTMNATHGLNIAIHSLVRPGTRVLISGYEHNAVTRPLHAAGARIRVAAAPPFDREGILAAFRRALDWAEVVVCTHVSNVFGFILPLEEVAALCRERAVPLIVDASQSAGVLPLDFSAFGCAFLACPGHKGLLGPQGTGLLLCRDGCVPLLHGGTGSQSAEQTMPDFLPDRLEAGTANIPGIAGLLEGLRYVNAAGVENIRAAEDRMLQRMAAALTDIEGLRLFYAGDREKQTSVLSVVHDRISGEEVAGKLAEQGIAVRAGLHCAPLAHESAGTLGRGTVRFSFSPFLSAAQLDRAVKALPGVFAALEKSPL